MKKISLLLASVLMASTSFAQDTPETPNRLLVTNNQGSYKGFVIDYTDNISFARVDGDVKTEIAIENVALDELTLSITRLDACEGFKICVLPQSIANQLTNDEIAINYINNYVQAPTYYQDFTNAQLSGIDLLPDSKYAVITVGIDRFGVEAGVTIANFETPGVPIVGNPQVTAEIVDEQLRSFTIKFTPNEDVSQYYCVAGETGTMQAQYEMFGPMFGFANFNQMIMAWGIAREGENEVEWTNMDPNTEYEVFVVCADMEGNLAPYQVFTVNTLALGGDGNAWVDIELGDYTLTDWYGEMLPSQFISFTPNDQASCYRMNVVKAENYDTDPEGYNAELCSDPFMPMAYWFFYEPLTSDYQIDPDTDCVAIAAAKNGNGEWGEVNVVRFTTPSTCTGAETAVYTSTAKIGKRFAPRKVQSSFFTPGKMPKSAKGNALQLNVK